jgi:hypothetical protein
MLLSTGCQSTITPITVIPSPEKPSLSAASNTNDQLTGMREAVFRYLIENKNFGQTNDADIYYFAVADKEIQNKHGRLFSFPLGVEKFDPSEKLMERFISHSPKVRKNSDCPKGTLIWSITGIRFRVTEIKWITDTAAEIKGGHDDRISTSWTVFTVVKDEGKWKVTGAHFVKGSVS